MIAEANKKFENRPELIPRNYVVRRSASTILFVRFIPILFFTIYLAITVFWFAFGPWQWPVKNPQQLYTFLFFSQVALFTGYSIGALRKPRRYYGRWKYHKIILFSLIFNLLLLLPTSHSRTGAIIPDVIEGLRNPGIVYYLNNIRKAAGVDPVEYIRIGLAPILTLLFPLTIFFWQQLTKTVRLLSVFVTAWTAAMWIAIGTNKGIADIVILVPWLLWASHLAGLFKLGRRARATMVFGAVISLILFFVLFTKGNVERTNGGMFYLESARVAADEDHFLVHNLPDNVKAGIIGLSSYVTQGYYGLSLSLQQPFIPTFGVGNSFFLYRNAARILDNPKIEYIPYPARLERYGWDAYVNWVSIYPWIASDVSFPGTILVVGIIGYLFARSWLDTIYTHNPFAVALYSQFSIMLFYFSANNQVLQTGEGRIGFSGIMLAWLLSRSKYRI